MNAKIFVSVGLVMKTWETIIYLLVVQLLYELLIYQTLILGISDSQICYTTSVSLVSLPFTIGNAVSVAEHVGIPFLS